MAQSHQHHQGPGLLPQRHAEDEQPASLSDVPSLLVQLSGSEGPQAVAEAAKALWLLSTEPQNRIQLVEIGVVGPLLISLKECKGEVRVYTTAAIAHLAGAKQFRHMLVRVSGVVPPLLDVVASDSGDARLGALTALSFLSQEKDNALFMVWETSALAVLVSVVLHDKGEAQLQACEILANLAQHVETAPALIGAGVVQLMISIISQTPVATTPAKPKPLPTSSRFPFSFSQGAKESSGEGGERRESGRWLRKSHSSAAVSSPRNTHPSPPGSSAHAAAEDPLPCLLPSPAPQETNAKKARGSLRLPAPSLPSIRTPSPTRALNKISSGMTTIGSGITSGVTAVGSGISSGVSSIGSGISSLSVRSQSQRRATGTLHTMSGQERAKLTNRALTVIANLSLTGGVRDELRELGVMETVIPLMQPTSRYRLRASMVAANITGAQEGILFDEQLVMSIVQLLERALDAAEQATGKDLDPAVPLVSIHNLCLSKQNRHSLNIPHTFSLLLRTLHAFLLSRDPGPPVIEPKYMEMGVDVMWMISSRSRLPPIETPKLEQMLLQYRDLSISIDVRSRVDSLVRRLRGEEIPITDEFAQDTQHEMLVGLEPWPFKLDCTALSDTEELDIEPELQEEIAQWAKIEFAHQTPSDLLPRDIVAAVDMDEDEAEGVRVALSDLTVEDVGDVLESIDMSQYGLAFASNKVDGEKLLKCHAEKDVEALGVSQQADRRQILFWINYWTSVDDSGDMSATQRGVPASYLLHRGDLGVQLQKRQDQDMVLKALVGTVTRMEAEVRSTTRQRGSEPVEATEADGERNESTETSQAVRKLSSRLRERVNVAVREVQAPSGKQGVYEVNCLLLEGRMVLKEMTRALDTYRSQLMGT